jgi:integrase
VQLLSRIAEFESARDRILSDDELRALWTALDDCGGEIAAAIRCAILPGGQRFRQMLRAKWTDYDRQAQTLLLTDPKGKRKRAAVLPVSPLLARELAILASPNGRGDCIYSTTGGKKPIHHTTISSEIGAIAKLGSGSDSAYRPGDIRRTAETRLQALGISRDVRAQLLSHGRSSGVQARHYERYNFLDERRAALKVWEPSGLRADQFFDARPASNWAGTWSNPGSNLR